MGSLPTPLPPDHPLQKLRAKPKQQAQQPSFAEKTAADWIRPGGGYDQWKKGDAEREKRLPPGGMEHVGMEHEADSPLKPKKPLAPIP